MISAFIPARSGSKGIRNKNNLLVGGHTLIDRALSLALSNSAINLTIVSTDSVVCLQSSSILDSFANQFQIQMPGTLISFNSRIMIHKRLPEDATDFAPTSSAVLDSVKSQDFNNDDIVVLLQPTSPFRISEELSEFLTGYQQSRLKTGLSVKTLESPHPMKAFTVNGSELQLSPQEIETLGTARQKLPSYFAPDGAFYAAPISHLREKRSFLSERNFVFHREGLRTLNIDVQTDYYFAEFIAEKNLF